MQRLTLSMIVTVTVIVFFAKGDPYGRFHLLPNAAGFLPELLGAIALIYVIVEGVRGRFQYVRPAYWLLLIAIGITVVCGVVANGVASGPIFTGLRIYLRAIPWFFLPAVYAFSEKQVSQQLKWLLFICLLQMPISIEQRITATDLGWGTGDTTQGMMQDSGILSIFLISATCVITGFYVRKILSLSQYMWLFLLVLLPTMINETKVTIFLLPVGLITAYAFSSEPKMRTKRILIAVFFLTLFGAIFIPVYDSLMQQRTGDVVTLKDFFTDDKQMDRYMTDKKDIGSRGKARRGDATIVPLKHLIKDPIRFVFGYGIGNVSESNFGHGFSGAYQKLWDPFAVTAFSKFFLELGMLGFVLVLIWYWLIFQDCRALASQQSGFYSAFAAGWTGVMAVMTIATFYSMVHMFPVLSFLFWYFAGLMAAARMRMATAARSEALRASASSHMIHQKAGV